MRKTRDFFVCQQGFSVPNANPHLYSGLMLQPQIIGAVVIIGTTVQSPELYLLLAAVLGWGTIAPAQNLFDAIYNRVLAFRQGWPPLGPAPAPRRFAQGSAAMLALAVGVALGTGATRTAWLLEGVFVVGVTSAVLRRFCLPAHLYHVLRRRLSPASSMAGSASQPC